MVIRSALLIVASDADPVLDVTVNGLRSLFSQAPLSMLFTEERRVASDGHLIEDILRRWCDEEEIDCILTLGGTFPAPGHSSEQITPEATLAVLERLMPSLPEVMRALAADEEPLALLDRGVAGIRTRTLIVNLPGPEELATRFAEAIVDLIAPIVRCLQPTRQEPESFASIGSKGLPNPSPQEKHKGLNADEFAAFLASRQRREN